MDKSFFYLSAEMASITSENEKTLSIYTDMQLLDKKINIKIAPLNLKITSHRLIFSNHPQIDNFKPTDINYTFFIIQAQYIKKIQIRTKTFSSKIDHLNLETDYGELSIYGNNLDGPLLQIQGCLDKKEWTIITQPKILQTSYLGLKKEMENKNKKTQESAIIVQSSFGGGFEDLFKNATELKEISNLLRETVKQGENNEVDQILQKIGCFQIIDKEGENYYQLLAEQIYKLCQELFPKLGGIISLLDIYYYFNKKRNQTLISPEEIIKASQQFQILNFQAKLTQYDGIKVIESTQFNTEKDFENTIGKFINYQVGLTAEQLAKRLGISVMICKIKLRNAIQQGKIFQKFDHYFMNLQQSDWQRVTDNLSQISQLSTRAPTIAPGTQQQQQQETLPFISYTTESIERQQKQQDENIKQQKLLADIRKLIVPTQISEIKSQLRQLGQPVTYFGESAPERRGRLKQLLEEHLKIYGRLPQFFKQSYNQRNQGNLENEYFLYEGIEELRAARIEIAKYSLHNAALRVEKQRLRRLTIDALQEDQEVLEELTIVNSFNIKMSQYADTSGISRCEISPNQQYLATAGGSGECKLWTLHDAQLQSSMLGHLTKCHSISFHPQSTLTLSPQSYANIATASADLQIRLWTLDLEQEKVQDYGILQKSIALKGHEDRVNKVLFHQSGKHLISVSYDKTWRLWDIETQKELLVQTGHSRALYSASIHPDGSLLFTGDTGGFGMGWDLRIGKGILPFQGHVKGILASDFSSNGYHLATGGDDNFIRIWDIRRRNNIERIPAHIKLVSDLKYQPIQSKFLMSASYDGNIKIWSSRDWSLHQIYEIQDTKITSLSLTKDLKTLVSCGLDRKFVVWQ